ncbi:MAG: hypothetical protein CMD40_03265 [Gammaproteobacteria bacterium]|nr:hypothetical protein [Gammaproteobacteria bacterium]
MKFKIFFILCLNFLIIEVESQWFNSDKPLFEKYQNSAVPSRTLVERQGLKYQVNTNKAFSGTFLTFEDEYGFCVTEAGSYKNGLLHGDFEAYEGCGTLYSYKTGYKNGLEHGKYTEYMDGLLYMEGSNVNGVNEGEWTGYENGLISWTENVNNGETVNYTEFLYHDNGQLSLKEIYNSDEVLHGISEAYHQNGQLKSKIEYKDGAVFKIIEKYDFNGNPIN